MSKQRYRKGSSLDDPINATPTGTTTRKNTVTVRGSATPGGKTALAFKPGTKNYSEVEKPKIRTTPSPRGLDTKTFAVTSKQGPLESAGAYVKRLKLQKKG